MIETVEELIVEHLQEDSKSTLDCYKCLECEEVIYRDPHTEELVGVILFFKEEAAPDYIITMSKNNKYSHAHWKEISRRLKERSKDLIIGLTDSNLSILTKGAKKYGGVRIRDFLYFKGQYKEREV